MKINILTNYTDMCEMKVSGADKTLFEVLRNELKRRSIVYRTNDTNFEKYDLRMFNRYLSFRREMN